MNESVVVVGLGYVGLPVAVRLAREVGDAVTGFDIDPRRVEALRQGDDYTREVPSTELRTSSLRLTSDPSDLVGATCFIVTVPTPIDRNRQPDLRPLEHASDIVGGALKPGSVVIYESTVYPGVTEGICAPRLEHASGLRAGTDFKLAYSPERINPGDGERTLDRVVKVVSAQDEETLERVAPLYERIVTAGVHRAPSIKVAEAAKVIENTQRDLNIALMNELALIFDRLDIRTQDVLEAAGTKWNFLPFSPGLVGGHCIGVDPYYLTTKAESVGYHPQVILAGRRINDGMGHFIAQRVIKLLVEADRSVKGARVGVLGLTFKENVTDLRNSRVPDILGELQDFGITPLIHDPLADPEQARQQCGLPPKPLDELQSLDALVLAVPHRAYMNDIESLVSRLATGGVVVDVKSALDASSLPSHLHYWSL